MFSTPNKDRPRAAAPDAGQEEEGRVRQLPGKFSRRGAPGPGAAEAFRRRVAAGWHALRANMSR